MSDNHCDKCGHSLDPGREDKLGDVAVAHFQAYEGLFQVMNAVCIVARAFPDPTDFGNTALPQLLQVADDMPRIRKINEQMRESLQLLDLDPDKEFEQDGS